VTRPEREQLSEAGDVDARDRFEGEHPERTWHHGRAVEALLTGYAPSKHPTKHWPPEALLEVWCSLLREAQTCFEIDALTLDRHRGEHATTRNHGPPVLRSRRPATAVALNANEPPGVDGEDVRDLDRYALDAAFSGRSFHIGKVAAELQDRAALMGGRRPLLPRYGWVCEDSTERGRRWNAISDWMFIRKAVRWQWSGSLAESQEAAERGGRAAGTRWFLSVYGPGGSVHRRGLVLRGQVEPERSRTSPCALAVAGLSIAAKVALASETPLPHRPARGTGK